MEDLNESEQTELMTWECPRCHSIHNELKVTCDCKEDSSSAKCPSDCVHIRLKEKIEGKYNCLDCTNLPRIPFYPYS